MNATCKVLGLKWNHLNIFSISDLLIWAGSGPETKNAKTHSHGILSLYTHTWVFNTMRILCIVKQIAILQQLLKCTDLKPMIGHSLQMLHLAWCLAVSAAATRWRTGSHTMDWGSRRIQSRNMVASSSGLLLAWNNNMTGYGVTVFSQKSGKEEKKSGSNPLP